MTEPRKSECPRCGYPLGPTRITIEFVDPDGCRRRGPGGNVRTRDHAGHGREGSLAEEMARGVRTPWSSLEAKEAALSVLVGEEREFAASLPYVRELD